MTRTSWLISFADLSAVLAAFMVLILAMSDFDTPALDRLVQTLGKADGTWQDVQPATGTETPLLVRLDADRHGSGDYLARIIEQTLARTGWPWTLAATTDIVAIQQPASAAGADVPDAMVAWLISSGYAVQVDARLVSRKGQAVATRGRIDDGLKAAQDLADKLILDGVARDVPVAVSFPQGATQDVLRIVLKPRKAVSP